MSWDSVQLADPLVTFTKEPCVSCGDADRFWDRPGGKVHCPICLDKIATCQSPLTLKKGVGICAACRDQGTANYITFPLGSDRPVKIDLCPDHFRDFIARRLGPRSFRNIANLLKEIELDIQNIFLLCDAFYNQDGFALQQAKEVFE